MGSKKFKPILNFIVLENPLTKEKGEAMKAHLEMLPSDQREEYLQSQMSNMIHKINVLDVGPEATIFKKGDSISIPGVVLESAFSVEENKLVIRETQAFGRWV